MWCMKTGYALILGFLLVPSIAATFAACGNDGSTSDSAPVTPTMQACLDWCQMHNTVCTPYGCSSVCNSNVDQAGTHCQDELKILMDCYLSHFPGTQNCNIMNDATCKFERSDFSLCLWTYECSYGYCGDITPTDGGTDGGLRCGCGKTCETVKYVERCTWNGTAFDCDCEKADASVGTCQIEGQPTCDTLDRYSYCCDPIFGL